MAITASVLGGGMLLNALGGWLGGNAQADAAREGQQLTAEQAAAAQAAAMSAANSADTRLQAYIPGIQQNMQNAYLGSQDYLGQGFGQQRQDLLQSGQLGAQALQQGQAGSLGALYGGASQGVDYLNQAQSGVDRAIGSGLQGASGLLMNRPDRGGAMLDQPGGLYGNFQADPGYQFRLEEGEKGLRSMQAARGGRFGGAALKEMERFRQGMASQEFGNYANRQNALYGAASQNDAMGLQARGQLAGMYGQAGSQLAGAQQGLGSQAASMMYGAGQGASNVYGQNAAQLSDVYGRTGTQLGSQAAGAGSALAANDANYYKGLADLDWNTVGQRNQYGLGAAGVAASMLPTLAQSNMQGAQYAGAGWNALGGLGGNLASLGMLYGAQNGAFTPDSSSATAY